MSLFKTEIPVHVDRINALLPKGSTIQKWEWDEKTNKLNLLWHNGQLQSKYTWPWPWTIEELERGLVPEGVTTPQLREEAAKAFEKWKEEEAARMAKEAQETQEREANTAKELAEQLAVEASKVRSQSEKVLTQEENSPKNRSLEKMAGKPHHKAKGKGRAKGASVSAHSTAGTSAVDGAGPERTGGVSEQHHGQ